MNKRRGFTLIELILTLCIVSIISSIAAHNVTSYFKTKNKYEVNFAENCILGIISNGKQYCREKNCNGYLMFSVINNDITFYTNGVIKDYFKMPGKIKLVSINTHNDVIEINNKGITGDACSITIRDNYGEPHYITMCVGTAYVEIQQ